MWRSPKSSPTTATSRTSLKNDAAMLKNVAAPPTTRETSPNGVRIESKATEPTVSTGCVIARTSR